MALDQNYQPNNLSTFRILYIIKGALSLFASLFFLGYAFLGSFVFGKVEEQNLDDLPFNPGNLFMIIGIAGFLIALAIGILSFLTAKYLQEQRNYQFIFIVAILSCLTGILGILLGVFTIIELNKPQVKALFQQPVRF